MYDDDVDDDDDAGDDVEDDGVEDVEVQEDDVEGNDAEEGDEEEEEDDDDEDDVVDDDDDLIKFIVRMLVGCISHVEFTTIQGTQVGAVAPIRQALHGRDSRFMGLIYIPH